MPELVLPPFQIPGVKFTIVKRADAPTGLPVHAADVNIFCDNNTDSYVADMARRALEQQIKARFGVTLVERAADRPKGHDYFFDHRRVLVSGDRHPLERALKRVGLDGNEPLSVYMNTTGLRHVLLEMPAMYIEETVGTTTRLNWYMAHVYLQIGTVEVTQQQAPANYLANFAIRYQIEMAPGEVWSEHASHACL